MQTVAVNLGAYGLDAVGPTRFLALRCYRLAKLVSGARHGGILIDGPVRRLRGKRAGGGFATAATDTAEQGRDESTYAADESLEWIADAQKTVMRRQHVQWLSTTTTMTGKLLFAMQASFLSIYILSFARVVHSRSILDRILTLPWISLTRKNRKTRSASARG